MARTVEIDEDERTLLLRWTQDEWDRLDRIRHDRWMDNDPILKDQEKVGVLLKKLR